MNYGCHFQVVPWQLRISSFYMNIHRVMCKHQGVAGTFEGRNHEEEQTFVDY